MPLYFVYSVASEFHSPFASLKWNNSSSKQFVPVQITDTIHLCTWQGGYLLLLAACLLLEGAQVRRWQCTPSLVAKQVTNCVEFLCFVDAFVPRRWPRVMNWITDTTYLLSPEADMQICVGLSIKLEVAKKSEKSIPRECSSLSQLIGKKFFSLNLHRKQVKVDNFFSQFTDFIFHCRWQSWGKTSDSRWGSSCIRKRAIWRN